MKISLVVGLRNRKRRGLAGTCAASTALYQPLYRVVNGCYWLNGKQVDVLLFPLSELLAVSTLELLHNKPIQLDVRLSLSNLVHFDSIISVKSSVKKKTRHIYFSLQICIKPVSPPYDYCVSLSPLRELPTMVFEWGTDVDASGRVLFHKRIFGYSPYMSTVHGFLGVDLSVGICLLLFIFCLLVTRVALLCRLEFEEWGVSIHNCATHYLANICSVHLLLLPTPRRSCQRPLFSVKSGVTVSL